ncbi:MULTISPECIES: DUF6088 family protein [unclassified Adlercreutzia]|uniref:DUF6088 family protein n=1 Tax=unclassified Adlercreutzia TaxID=2636013 RepID=UPI0013EE0909|nr:MULTISPECIES: DUF6088 family protein [unclassified Adlercreutzia]
MAQTECPNLLVRNGGNVLGHMHAREELARVVQRVYYAPKRSELLGAEVPASIDEVIRVIARTSKWIVTPIGDTALNALGLDAQVPARAAYVSSGPHKTYAYGPYEIELRHHANRNRIDRSPMTRTIIQALKTLDRGSVGERTIQLLARNLSKEGVGLSSTRPMD